METAEKNGKGSTRIGKDQQVSAIAAAGDWAGEGAGDGVVDITRYGDVAAVAGLGREWGSRTY